MARDVTLDLLGDLALYFAIMSGIAVGLYIGGWLVLGMAGQFVGESLAAVKTTALELLTNPTVQSLARAADKWKGGGAGGGMLGAFIGRVAKWLGVG